MKILSLFLISIFTLQSFAWAGPQNALKSILDDYHYALTVEWDQQDQEQLKSIKSAFSEALKKHVEEEKLTVEDLEAFIQAHSRELKVDAHILSLVKDEKGKIDVERAERLLEENSKQIYMNGSSWAPDIGQIVLVGFGILFVFEMVVLIATTPDDLCPSPDYHPNDIPYECHY